MYQSVQNKEDEIKRKALLAAAEMSERSQKRSAKKKGQTENTEVQVYRNLPTGKVHLLMDVKACLFSVNIFFNLIY